MGFQCGIVGLPNVGKSTIFNALTSAGAEAANFPFCTKDPNVGVVKVPDARLDALAAAYRPRKVTPAVMRFVDIAGLVKGASKGEGLGNQFLSHIREVDAIMHVVRCFEDVDVAHVEGSVDPVRDAELVGTELVLKDLETLQARVNRDQKLANSGDAEAKKRLEAEKRARDCCDSGLPITSAGLDPEDSAKLWGLNLLTIKPMFYCANVLEEGPGNTGPLIQRLGDYAEKLGHEMVVISGKLESEIAELPESERRDYLLGMGLEEAALNRVIRTGYHMLGLQTFFTAGDKEVRGWTVRRGAKAPQAAGVIHSDFEKGFIRAETLAYRDFEACGSWNAAKEKGLVRTEGKEYVVGDGDILYFLFNV